MNLACLTAEIDRRAPFSTALSYDNAGILYGDPKKEIRCVLVALDVTHAVIDEAEAIGADLILSHHPALFVEKKTFSPDETVCRLISKGIAAVAAHTNLDAAKDGVNDVLAEKIGLKNVSVLTRDPDGIARGGTLPEACSLREFAARVKDTLNAVPMIFSDGGRQVKHVAVCGGAGGELWENLVGTEFDTLLTGEAKHHQFIESAQAGINLVVAGHFATEVPILPTLAQWMREADSSLRVVISSQCDPVRSL